MVGYIGANGAGKSTTIKMLCGILTPTSGEVQVTGIVPYKERQRNARNIGAVFGQRTQLIWDIPVRESFNLLRHIYRVPEEQFEQNLNEFVDILSLERLLSRPVRQMSSLADDRLALAAIRFDGLQPGRYLHRHDVPNLCLDTDFHSNGYRATALMTPVVAVLCCVVAYLFWTRGLRAYSSTGT